jgi:ribosomal protein S6--L-glutamate ligase
MQKNRKAIHIEANHNPRLLRRSIRKHVIIGWKEWCALPSLDIPGIKAKIDTGAKTSSLHAYDIEPIQYRGETWVRFSLHPLQRHNEIVIVRKAKVTDQRYVTSSSGHRELRYVINTTLKIGKIVKTIELTLANREKMVFKMLLGRDALTKDFIISPDKQHCQGLVSQLLLKRRYKKELTK